MCPTWVGDALIMVIVSSDNYLNSSSMYFLLGNLSFLDLWYSTGTTPKLLADFLDNDKLIRSDQCTVQLFFLHFVRAPEMLLLTVMVYNHYVAVCHHLHYTTIMSQGLCCVLVAASWMWGFVHSTCPEDSNPSAFLWTKSGGQLLLWCSPCHQTCLCRHICHWITNGI